MWLPTALALLFLWPASNAQKNPTFAFTYTTETQNWSADTTEYEAIYVYAGDVEFYCRGLPTASSGGGASPADTPCIFNGTDANAFVYYNDFAKKASASLKALGKTVYINFDGRIEPKDEAFVPAFSLLTTSEMQAMAAVTAAHVCDDPNVDGMAWDVEPFNNDQTEFFAALDEKLTACGKRWGVFAFGETLSEDMWTRGLGKSGFLFDSTYDIDCSASVLPPHGCQPCQCTPPSVYGKVLPSHISAVMSLAKKYQKPYRLMVSGSGSTQLYTSLSTSYCSGAGGGAAFNSSCDYTMGDWMNVALDVFSTYGVKNDPLFEGIGVYGYTTTNGGGFSPVTPPASSITALKTKGYLPYASPTDEEFQLPARKQHQISNQTHVDHYMVGSPMNFDSDNKCLKALQRPIGCACDKSWKCDSNWCHQSICMEHP